MTIAPGLPKIFKFCLPHFRLGLPALIMASGILWSAGSPGLVRADSPANIEGLPAPALAQLQQNDGADNGRDANCLMCHSDPDFKGTFQNGEIISLNVDSGQYEQSVHGPAGLECLACHTAINRYPHHDEEQVSCLDCHSDEMGGDPAAYATLRVNLAYQDRRAMTLASNESCRSCHTREFEVAVDSAHVKVLEGGNRQAPVCVDCHGSHDISRADQAHSKVSAMCGRCHTAVYSTYRTSVHGAALEAEGNPDVPTCTECHGVHNVRGPRDTSFRNDSIVICGNCHANEALMEKYGISTAVFETYLDDFHGRTVDLFRRQGRGNPSNKAVCFDCHGIHNIRRDDDPLSTIYPTNLQHTCQQCHADANIKFPRAWLSHYIPTWQNTPILFAVNNIYQYFIIPATLGGFMLYIGLDVRKRWSERRQQIRQAVALAEKELEDELGDDHFT